MVVKTATVKFAFGSCLALVGAACIGYVVYAVPLALDLYAISDALQRQPQPAWYILASATPFILAGLALIAGGFIVMKQATRR